MLLPLKVFHKIFMTLFWGLTQRVRQMLSLKKLKTLRSKLKEREWSSEEQGSSNKGITSNDVNDDVHL